MNRARLRITSILDRLQPSESAVLIVTATLAVVNVHPDETVGTALRRMAPRDLSRLPVVARDNVHKLVGDVRRNDIVTAYDIGSARRAGARQRAEQTRAVYDSRAQFGEVQITPDSFAAGRRVAQLESPHEVVLVFIRRGRNLMIPRGDTQLRAGDAITILSERGCTQAAREVFLRRKKIPPEMKENQ